MSFYGKLGGLAVCTALIGGASVYIADIGGSVAATATELGEQLTCYILKEQDGCVALFKEGSNTPVILYSLPAEGISAADAELLKKGIQLRGMDEVMRLLEDLDIDSLA